MIPTAILSLLFAIATHATPPHVSAAEFSKEELQAMAMADATAYHLSIPHFLATIGCESHWDSQAIGDHGQSYGIVQIYLPAHKDITGAEALDPIFALNWAAEEWSEGRAYEWTCERELVKNDWKPL